ncbi:MAG: tryptophan synthase subunit alpha [Planctomycetota bacterium]
MRYRSMFERLKSLDQSAFVPFFVVGDPDLATSLTFIESAIESGADALELGIPFTDAVADGPVIQEATRRAISAGATPERCFDLIAILRDRHPKLPLGLLTYANLTAPLGLSSFYRMCAEAGLDSLLFADVPFAESRPFIAEARRYRIAPISIVPPDPQPSLLRGLAEVSGGYTYVLGRGGVTGANRAPNTRLPEVIAQLQELGAPPALVGFGISQPEHLLAARSAGAAGVISGSAIVERIANHLGDPNAARLEISRFVDSMKSAQADKLQ